MIVPTSGWRSIGMFRPGFPSATPAKSPSAHSGHDDHRGRNERDLAPTSIWRWQAGRHPSRIWLRSRPGRFGSRTQLCWRPERLGPGCGVSFWCGLGWCGLGWCGVYFGRDGSFRSDLDHCAFGRRRTRRLRRGFRRLGERRTSGLCQFQRALVTLLRLLCHTGCDDGVKTPRHLRVSGRRSRRRVAQVSCDLPFDAVAGERPSARQTFVQDACECVDVDAMVELVAANRSGAM